ALGSRLCARTQCLSGTALAEGLWPARGCLVGHRADRTADWRRVRELWALARRVCHGRWDRVPASCWRPVHASSRQVERRGCQSDFSSGPRCLDLRRDRAVVGGEHCNWPGAQGHAHHSNRCGVRRDDADRSAAPLLPSDAFSLWSGTGAGLWMVLLMSVGYSPLAIYAPLFLQRMHGVSPLGAGYMVALASLAWTTAALSVASLSEEWPARLIVIGPSAMGVGLAGVGVLMAPGPVAALILPIAMIGAGIGAAWAFVRQRVMSGAKGGEENTAAASAATVQQAGIAWGAAPAGLVANASGLDGGLDPGSVLRASLWVPLALVAAPVAAGGIGVRLNL